MMPVALRRLGAPGGRVPILGDLLRLGRDPEGDVVEGDPRVRARHARLRQVKGEWVLSAEGDAPLWVNGTRAALFPLRPGDRIDLVAVGDAVAGYVFEDALAGAFVAPGIARLAAWLAQPAARAAGGGLARYGLDLATTSEGASVLVRPDPSGEGGPSCRVELGPALADAGACQAALEVAVVLAGAPHPALAHVLEVGATPTLAGPRPWLVSRHMPGPLARDVAGGAPAPLGRWLVWMAALARGLAWLHRRRCLHRGLGLDAVVLPGAGGAVLLPQLASRPWRAGVAPHPGVVRTPGFEAPEELARGGVASAAPLGAALDIYDLCALGVALLAGSWDADAAARVTAQRTAPGRGLRLAALGVRVPDEVEQLLLEGLAPAPPARPNAADLARRLEGLASLWGMEPA